jgi:hypothetical protein
MIMLLEGGAVMSEPIQTQSRYSDIFGSLDANFRFSRVASGHQHGISRSIIFVDDDAFNHSSVHIQQERNGTNTIGAFGRPKDLLGEQLVDKMVP